MTKVKITERGWAGHFICANHCRFRRNTLIEYKNKKWVVSTVGAMVIENEYTEIGYKRWYETMAFVGEEKNGYIDAKVSQEIPFDNEWGIFGDTWEQVLETSPNIDNTANDMHDTVVKELAQKIVGEYKGGDLE